MEQDITATFNGNPTVSFVQGEDRALAVALRNNATGQPVDLTDSGVHFEFVGTSGWSVRRFSDSLTLPTSSVGPGENFVFLAHGLVTGDPVTFAGSSLPAPLVTATTYLVVVVDANTFSLTDQAGNPITITAAALDPFTLACADVVVNSPATSGVATLTLRSLVTAAIQQGLGQTFQVEIKTNGLTRIYLEPLELDVYPQVV